MQTSDHPGAVLKRDVIDLSGLQVQEAAGRLGMSRPALSRVLNGRASISPDLAVRLEKAGVLTARHWMDLQTAYDLAQARARPQPKVGRITLKKK
jgi:addiction module HigA family antidote